MMATENELKLDISENNIELNETELCNKVLFPYLQSLNIPLSNIALEQSFSIRLGHTVLDIKGKKKQKLSGRLDVLVKNSDGQNLFIIELKAPHVELSDDDASQGISYARLLDQIAPFVIVTNGKTSRVYDAITKQELESEQLKQSDFWINSRQLSTQDDLNIRFEAMQHFLGYSNENLKNFCLIQRERGMSALKGKQSNRKFNPDTYVKREDVRAAINCFIKSNGVAFAILGESGVGKTNEICSLAEELGGEHLVLFINATEISEAIDKTLSNEFNWGFSENITFPEIARRLTRLGKTLNKKVLLLIDSLDEAEAINIERSISELASNISTSNGIIKLIVSIKTADWSRFSKLKGTISKLHLLLDKSWYNADADSLSDPRPFTLKTFNEAEKKEAIEAYSKFYDLSSFPEGTVKKFCEHPFLLRIISELYTGSKDIPDDISEELLIDTWIQKKLEKTDEPERYRMALIKLAQAIYQESRVKGEQKVNYTELSYASIQTVCKDSNPLDTISIFKQLESIGFITAQKDHKGASHYSFYYGPVRDYFLARYILKLDEISEEQLLKVLPTILENSILRSSLFWHLRKAPLAHTHMLNSLITSRAEEFITTYNQILDCLFPSLKPYLPPYTSHKIGVCFKYFGELLEYAVFPVNEHQRKNVVELQYSMWDERSYKELYDLGVASSIGGGANFLNEDPKKSAAKYTLEMINKAIQRGNLNESNSETTLQEGILAIISTNDFLHENSHLDENINHHLPLNLDEIHKEIQLAFGREQYKTLWMNKYIEGEQKKNPNQTIFSTPPIPEEKRKEFEKDLVASVEHGKVFNAPNISNYRELKVINALITQLSVHTKKLKEHVLPLPDLNEVPHYRNKFSNYSRERLIEYIEKFYFKAIESYKKIVALNFPGLLHKLDFINKLPNEILVEIHRNPEIRWFRYAFTHHENKKLSVIVKVNPEQPLFSFTDGILFYDGVQRKCYQFFSSDFLFIFSPYQGPGYNAKQSSLASAMPIRTFVYKQIKEDFKKITAEDLLIEIDL